MFLCKYFVFCIFMQIDNTMFDRRTMSESWHCMEQKHGPLNVGKQTIKKNFEIWAWRRMKNMRQIDTVRNDGGMEGKLEERY